MKKVWTEHIISVFLVSGVLLTLIFHFNAQQKTTKKDLSQEVAKWTDLTFIDFDNPMHRAILEESLNIFDSTKTESHSALLKKIRTYRQQQVLDAIRSNDLASPVNIQKLKILSSMYGRFILVFLVTILITYYGVQTLGTFRFILFKRKQLPYSVQLFNHLKKIKYSSLKNLSADIYIISGLLFKAILKAILYLILFSPAYVLAYSFRTRFGTDMIFFMIVLGVVSNAMLITYTNKFFTFLLAESRKGYVQTAIVKNMHNLYKIGVAKGISWKNLLAWNKKFSGHVLDHIYQNAHIQYFPTIKEQASFLITGLIIIEMALNIQNHLCYELLQNILYANYAAATVIVLGIYLLVKTTEIAVDFFSFNKLKRYSN